MATKINLKDLVDLFVRTAAKYQKEPLGPFAAKMATLTAHVFQLTERVNVLDRVVAAMMMKQQQETAAAGSAPVAAPTPAVAAPATPTATPSTAEEEEQAFNDIERETAAELAAVRVTPLRKPAEAPAPTAKEAS